jgi:two-component system cell cycle response regulator
MSARVLVVDDILPNVKLLEAKLSSEYYDVLVATGGEEALKKVVSDAPDIVLLDVMMPGMDGFEVCKKIKHNPETAHIPVVMVTALTDTEDRVYGLEAGADDFLSKPVNDTALMARVRSLVRLKMTVDEWRVRENTASQLGVVGKKSNVMDEPVEDARILIVEDQGFESEKFTRALRTDKDDLVVVSNGAEAMGHLSGEDYDLMVVSLNLREEDGLRLCSHLRSNEKTRSTPILMVAEDDDLERVAHGLEIGAHDYIMRPVDRNEFLARCRTQIRRKRFQDRLRANYEISLSMALTDPLTGLYNRRYLEVHLQKLLDNNESRRKPIGLLMLDIDHFKQVNDTYGHSVGDEVLKEYSQRLVNNVRSFDLVARLGGEEFVVILPDVTETRAQYISERLRTEIGNTSFSCNVPEGKLDITTSIGGTLIESGGISFIEALKGADNALYEAKHSGRNCVVFDGIGKLDPEDFVQEERPTID